MAIIIKTEAVKPGQERMSTNGHSSSEEADQSGVREEVKQSFSSRDPGCGLQSLSGGTGTDGGNGIDRSV